MVFTHPRESWVLPSRSQAISLFSWGLDGRKAEIHRCFSLLGRGRYGYAAQVNSGPEQGWGEPELGELRLDQDILGYKQGLCPNPTASARNFSRSDLAALTSRCFLSAFAGTAEPLLGVCLLGPRSQQQLVPGTLPMQQPEQEHMAWDALELQAEVSNL